MPHQSLNRTLSNIKHSIFEEKRIKFFLLIFHSPAPSEVLPPTVTPLSSMSLQVNWIEPNIPNGVIVNYTIYSADSDDNISTLLTTSSSPGAYEVDGLQSYTEYGFILIACTSAGCNQSAVGTGFTAESSESCTSCCITFATKMLL